MKQMPGFLIAFILLASLLIATNSLADTGTYRIIDYSVTLNPKLNGEILMDYSQTWLVTGGYIPWVTVGLPNANYQITSWGGAAKKVSNGNEGSWNGARVDLNRNYQPNEVFTYNFTILQRNLVNQRPDGYGIEFTPGWYDRCTIDKLSIKVVSPTGLKNVTANPRAATSDGRTLLFSKNNLGMGERYRISVQFPKEAGFKVLAQSSQSRSKSGDNSFIPLIFIIVVFAVIFLALYLQWTSTNDGYSDYGGPVVYSGRIGRGRHRDHDSGGSGSFGGRASSCACVSCDCACACACAGGGGGGAGCAKKWVHSCNKCDSSQYSTQNDFKEEKMGDSG
jgi:hypothetical protein